MNDSTENAVTIQLNGEERRLEGITTLGELLVSLGIDATKGGVAVALNLDVIPRDELQSRPLSDGDRVELVQAVQGG